MLGGLGDIFGMPSTQSYVPPQEVGYTVDSRYLEIEGTLKNSLRYPYFDISDL